MKRSVWQFGLRAGLHSWAIIAAALLVAAGPGRAQDAPSDTPPTPPAPSPADAPPDTPPDSGSTEVLEPIGDPLEGLDRKQPPKPDKRRPSDPLLTIDWGLGGALPTFRCVPVKVSLEGHVEAFSGVITFRYRSDSTQTLAVTVPVAATPGKTSVYTPVLSYPGPNDKIEVVLSERSGRVVMRLWYAPAPDDTEIRLPPVRPDPDPLVVAIGPRQSGAGSVNALRSTVVHSRINPVAELAIDTVVVDPATLPTLAWAYDGASVVVVQSDAVRLMDERAAAALREWVLAGGWLVVVASSGDESWSSWLPPALTSGPTSLLELAEPTSEPMPAALARIVSTEVAFDRSSLAGKFPSQAAAWASWRDSPQWMSGPTVAESIAAQAPPAPPPPETEKERATPVDDVVIPAPQVTARWITLTSLGRRAGWSVGLRRIDTSQAPVEMGPSAPISGVAGDQGLIAQGPVGFGWVTMLGFDPRRTTETVTEKGSQRVWAEVLGLNARSRPPGEPLPRILQGPPPPPMSGWSGMIDSGGGVGLGVVLDAVASSEAPGRAVFLLVAIAAGMVPLLIGPVDYLVLKRTRTAHRSWLTALGWISLASLAAWLVPLAFRSSTTTVSRINAIDVMMPLDDGGGGGSSDGTQGPEPLTFQTGITGVFAAGTMGAELRGLPAHASIRGVAGDTTSWTYSDVPRPMSELPIAQASPGLEASAAGADAWGGFGPATPGTESFGDQMLEGTWRLWTFRAVEDRARVRGTVRATIEHVEGGLCRVRVTGLPVGAVVARGAVVSRGVWRELSPGEVAADGVVLNSGASTQRAVWEPRPTIRSEASYAYFDMQIAPTIELAPGAALVLNGPYARGEAIETFIESGAWDAVYLHVTDLPPSVSLNESTKNSEQSVYRIIIPRAAPSQDQPR